MQKNRIMVFGTFDRIHKGHLDFFNQARRISPNSFLIVSIARDKNVERIKGKSPELNQKERMNLVKKIGVADKVVLGGDKSHIPHILKEKPSIIALGYDQRHYTSGLKKSLKNKGLSVKIIRLKPFRKEIYKNRLLKKKRRL